MTLAIPATLVQGGTAPGNVGRHAFLIAAFFAGFVKIDSGKLPDVLFDLRISHQSGGDDEGSDQKPQG